MIATSVKTEEEDGEEHESIVNSSTEEQNNTTNDNQNNGSFDFNENVTSTENEATVETDAEGDSDAFNGNLVFTTNESNDYYYPEFDAGLRAPIVKCLLGWNTTHPFNSDFYDKRFVGVLLKELFGNRNYVDNELDPKRISLVKSLQLTEFRRCQKNMGFSIILHIQR